MFSFKKTNQAVDNIDKFFDTIDQSLLVFKAGVKDYLYSNTEDFNKNLETISRLDSEASILRREIESNLYTQSVLVRFRGDIMRLLESMNHIIDILNNSLFQFEIELPFIPSELNSSFMKLTELSTLAVECAIPAAKAYFKSQDTITEKIHRVYFYEKEADKQAQALKRRVFHEMSNLKLSEKFHLRYFALHIENLSDAAEKVADQLSVMSIKRGI
ncbi:MAG: DUF47 family protein [Bacteroidales bacterium]|jgi:hypothetical protein|nr:DUF47 family protein [Bacteroidales bacterium]